MSDDFDRIFPDGERVEHWQITPVNREAWLMLLQDAKPNVTPEHKQKWGRLKSGADAHAGKKELYVNTSDYDLINRYANPEAQHNEEISGPARPGVGSQPDLPDSEELPGGGD